MTGGREGAMEDLKERTIRGGFAKICTRRCFKGVDPVLDGYPKLVAIDEEADHQVVHRRRFGKHPLEGSCQEATPLPYTTVDGLDHSVGHPSYLK